MKKLFVLIVSLHIMLTYSMDNQIDIQMTDQILSRVGSFNINLFSITIDGQKRFQVEQFQNLVEEIDLSFLPSEIREEELEPDAFVAALEFLPTYFCENDESIVTREVIRTLLMHPEIRRENKYRITINTWITKYFSFLINKTKYYNKNNCHTQIPMILSGIPDIPNTLLEKQYWLNCIKNIITDM
jgi:hypothetical protein